MSKPIKKLERLNEEHHLTLQLMQGYLEENLPDKEMHQIERHLLDCELCADAMEGLSIIKDPAQADESVFELKRKVRKRSLREPVRKRKKKPAPLLWRHMSVAAATIILVAGNILVFKLNTSQKSIQPISLSQEKAQPSSPALTLPDAARQQAPAYSDASPVENTNGSKRKAAANASKPAPQASTKETSVEKRVTESDAGLAPEVAIDQIEEQLIDKEAIVLQEQESIRQVPQAVVAEAKREEARKEVLSGKRAPAPSEAVGITQNFITISGKVAAVSDTTMFLPGVKVNIKGTNTSITTDYRGRFSLAVPPKSTLVFSIEGMNTAEVSVASRKPVNVLLQQKGVEQETTADDVPEEIIEEDNLSYKPQPENGLMSYRTYLKKNLVYPLAARQNNIQGNVRVEFSVKADGQMADLVIKKGLGYGCDQEAMRLIKEGPAWKPAIANGKKVERKITVFVPFKL